jgi:hypothetical protein
MASSSTLTGIDLIDCAQACAQAGLHTAIQQCGYGEDVAAFQAALKQACQERGIEIETLQDWAHLNQPPGQEISPQSFSQL